MENTLVAGVTGANADMLRGNTLATVVENRHRTELSDLANIENIYFSNQEHAAGILEGVAQYWPEVDQILREMNLTEG